MYNMLSTPLTCPSIGAATAWAIISASAPGYAAETVTTGGAISGYCATGSLIIAPTPAITITVDKTTAKIGRWMQNREIIYSLLFCLWLNSGFDDFERRAGLDLNTSVHDYRISGMEPFVNKPFVTIPVAQFDGTQFRFALRAYYPYETPFRTLEHRPLG